MVYLIDAYVYDDKLILHVKEYQMAKHCDKCGNVPDESIVFDFREKAKICEMCIIDLYAVVDKKYAIAPVDTKKKTTGMEIPSIEGILEHLNKNVVGQDNAKDTIAIAVRNHYKRMSLPDDEKKLIEKSNILLMGNSGTGKTHLIKTLAEYIDVPLMIVDSSTYTTSGYVGNDVEDIIKDLYERSGKSKSRTEKGIVFLDEIDKKKKSKDTGGKIEPGGEQAQQSFLKLVEGKEITIGKDVIDTSNILFISGGAFVGIMDIIKRRQKKSTFGYGMVDNNVDTEQLTLADVTTEDLIEYGLIPEFVGRFPIITHTNDLSKQEIINIIKSVDNSILKQYKKLFQINDELDLDITQPAIEEISEMVIRDKIGVRGVRKVVERVLHNVQRHAESIKNDGGRKVIIGKGVICNTSKPVVHDIEGKKIPVKKYFK